jgi:hypothetical protein
VASDDPHDAIAGPLATDARKSVAALLDWEVEFSERVKSSTRLSEAAVPSIGGSRAGHGQDRDVRRVASGRCSPVRSPHDHSLRPRVALERPVALGRGRAFDRHAVNARVTVMQQEGRCTLEVSEFAGDALSVGGAVVFGEQFVLVVVPDDPAPEWQSLQRGWLVRASASP